MDFLHISWASHLYDRCSFRRVSSIPLLVSKKPRNFLTSTLNTHLSGLSFRLYLAIVVNRSSRSTTSWFSLSEMTTMSSVEPSGVQTLKKPNPLQDVEASGVLDVVVLV